MRVVLVGCAIVAGCGGGGAVSMPPTADGGGGGIDGTSSNATKITFTLTNVPSDVDAFGFVAAYQDGDGAWQPAATRSGDAYAFDVSSPTWGFAYTCQVNVRVAGVLTALRDVVEYHFAVAERTTMTDDILDRCTDRIKLVELSGNISGRQTTGTYRVGYNGTAVFIDRANGNYDMLVAPGTHDLLVLHGSDGGTTGDFLIDAAVVQRNVAINAATQTQNVSANNASGTKGLTITVNVPNKTLISAETTTNLFTASGTAVAMAHVTNKGQLRSTALQGTQVATTDVYDQRVTVEFVAGQAVTQTTATATPANRSITTAPTPLGTATVTSAATMPYPTYKSTWPSYAGAIGYTWTLEQGPAAAGCAGATSCTTWTAWLSPGVVGSMPSYTMPDLSHLQGWSTALQLVGGAKLTGQVTAMTSSAGAPDFPPRPPAAGTTRVFAHSEFTLTPPP
jgi:hypothetical protein